MKTPDNDPPMAKKASRSKVTARRKMASLRIGVQRRQFRMRATATVLAAILESSSEPHDGLMQMGSKK